MAVPVGYQPIIATDPNPQPPNDVPINEDVESHFGSTFSDKEIRRKFVRKVCSDNPFSEPQLLDDVTHWHFLAGLLDSCSAVVIHLWYRSTIRV